MVRKNTKPHLLFFKELKQQFCYFVAGKTYFEGQSKVGVLPRFIADREYARLLRAKHQASNQNNSYTFTDLAQMVCKVSRGNRFIDAESSDSDEMEEYEADLEEEDAHEVGYASEPTVGILDQVRIFFN